MPVLPPCDPARIQRFAQSMRAMRESAGQPPIKELARAAGYSETTVRDVLKASSSSRAELCRPLQRH